MRAAVEKICARFGDDYWLKRDSDGEFPEEFYRAIADGGWLGICIPQEFGGSGLGVSEAAVMMHTITASGAGLSGASAVHMNIFGLNPVVVYGTEEQKRRMLPPIVAGAEKACFAVTEPDAGLETAKIKTTAKRHGDTYVVSGAKIWISTAQVADRMLILARTAPLGEGRRPTDGLSLFYTALDRRFVEIREIEKMGRKAVDSNALFIDGLEVPAADRIGEEGRGFEYILHGLNPERVLVAAEAIGLGRAALRPRHGLRQGARRVRPADRAEPGDPASAGAMLDGARSRRLDDAQSGLAIRPRPALRAGGQRGKISGRRGRLQSLPDRDRDPWRLRLRQGIPRRTLFPRNDDPQAGAGVAATHSLLYRREGPRAAEVILMDL